MGIFINLKLSETIAQEEWASVYKRSLVIAKKFGFYDCGSREMHGERIACIFPTQERRIGDETGWCVVGSLPTYKRAEDQFMPKTLGSAARKSEPYDILRIKIPYEENERSPYIHLWGNKTQGEPYHMGLLAIGCVAEQMLGIQALVDGDITYRQCLTAAEMASQILGEKIQPPVCCRMQDLQDRLQKFDTLSELEKLELFMDIYLGDDDDELGTFLYSSYASDTLTSYWQEQFKDKEIGGYGFIKQMKRYLLLSPDLAGFCKFADFDKTDAEQCKAFIRAIMKSSLHLKEKDCYDPLDLKHYPVPYGIGNLMASFFLRSAVNPAIDRYIPLDEIRSVLTEQLGAAINVNSVIDSYLAEQERSTEESGHKMLMNKAEEYEKEKNEQYSKYDICAYDELTAFTTDSKLHPKLIDGIRNSFQLYHGIGEKPKCTELMRQSADELFHYLAAHMDSICLTEQHWKQVYNELHRDKTAFKRYYPMLHVKITEEIAYLIRAFIEDDALWNYCCEHFDKEAE